MKIKSIKAPQDQMLVSVEWNEEDELIDGGIQSVRLGKILATSDPEITEIGHTVIFEGNFEVIGLLSDSKRKVLGMHKNNLRAILELEE